MTAFKDTRPPIKSRGTHQVTEPFTHTDHDCPCEPWQLTINPNGTAITVTMHRPATSRGNLEVRRPLIRKGES